VPDPQRELEQWLECGVVGGQFEQCSDEREQQYWWARRLKSITSQVATSKWNSGRRFPARGKIHGEIGVHPAFW
jgi:hypothetical protein